MGHPPGLPAAAARGHGVAPLPPGGRWLHPGVVSRLESPCLRLIYMLCTARAQPRVGQHRNALSCVAGSLHSVAKTAFNVLPAPNPPSLPHMHITTHPPPQAAHGFLAGVLPAPWPGAAGAAAARDSNGDERSSIPGGRAWRCGCRRPPGLGCARAKRRQCACLLGMLLPARPAGGCVTQLRSLDGTTAALLPSASCQLPRH